MSNPLKVETVQTSIGSCHKVGFACIYDDFRNKGEETERLTQAHLFAAAPEMLDALKAFVKHEDDCLALDLGTHRYNAYRENTYLQAKKAIAKSETRGG